MTTEADRRALAAALAGAFLAGAWNEDRLVARAAATLAPRPRWLRRLAREVLSAYHRPPADRPRELTAYVALVLAELDPPVPVRVRRQHLVVPSMAPTRWAVPPLRSPGELAAWLELQPGELAWLADARGLERRSVAPALRHYRYSWVAREDGRPRVLERPKRRLKAIQRRLLHEIIEAVPPHDAVHGFRRGRSARTHAAAHVGQEVVLRFDLEDFFAAVSAARVYGVLRTAGYPERVAHALTALSTNVVPIEEWEALPRPRDAAAIAAHHRLGRRLATPHLPQGAPTSPALANLAAFRLDRRLAGLAGALGARYTRYADDLVLSGNRELRRRAGGLGRLVATLAGEEGFAVNPRKSRVTARSGRQRVGGIVVNERLNVARAEYDELKAILHNCRRDGPQAHNRDGVADFEAHLRGRVAWVGSLHPARGARLNERLDAIDWS